MKTTKYICKTCKKGFNKTESTGDNFGVYSQGKTQRIEVCPHCGSDAFEKRPDIPTKKQLMQYYYLQKEIDKASERLSDIDKSSPRYAELYELIENNKLRCMALLIKLESFIYSIDDSLTRQIFELRYIYGYSWNMVSVELGGYISSDCARMIHSRYLARLNQ